MKVYILQSEATGKLYIGQTSNLEIRIKRHNADEPGSNRYTHKHIGSWRLVYSEQLSTRIEAMKKERFLKTGQGREWIRENIARS